jgi:hypothetical protein
MSHRVLACFRRAGEQRKVLKGAAVKQVPAVAHKLRVEYLRFSVALFVASLCGSFAGAQPSDAANRPEDRPAPRTDRNSQIAHEQLLEKATKFERLPGLGRRIETHLH